MHTWIHVEKWDQIQFCWWYPQGPGLVLPFQGIICRYGVACDGGSSSYGKLMDLMGIGLSLGRRDKMLVDILYMEYWDEVIIAVVVERFWSVSEPRLLKRNRLWLLSCNCWSRVWSLIPHNIQSIVDDVSTCKRSLNITDPDRQSDPPTVVSWFISSSNYIIYIYTCIWRFPKIGGTL